EHVSWDVFKHEDPVSAVAADPSGQGVWVGFLRGGVAHFADGHIRTSYGPANGLAAGRISELHGDTAGTLWIATDAGLTRLKNGRLATLASGNGLPCDSVGWIVDDKESFWLGMACGLVRVARAEIDAWSAAADRTTATDHDTPSAVHAALFDHRDGV